MKRFMAADKNSIGILCVIHGSDSKVGTTMLAQSIAEMIAEHRQDLSVIMIALHGRSGTDYLNEPAVTLDNIRTVIEGRMLSGEELRKLCVWKKNLHILGGFGSAGLSRGYFPEMADHLLSICKESFDFVITDSGNEMDCGLAVGALRQDAHKILVLTQHETAISRYEAISDIFDRLDIRFSEILINKYQDTDPYDVNYIAKRLNVSHSMINTIAYAEKHRKAESDHLSLLHYGNRQYCRDIDRIAVCLLRKLYPDERDVKRKGMRWIVSK